MLFTKRLFFNGSFFLSYTFRYKATMIDDVPRIFEAVFQCTLEVRVLVIYILILYIFRALVEITVDNTS
jgi:hypothetical protein